MAEQQLSPQEARRQLQEQRGILLQRRQEAQRTAQAIRYPQKRIGFTERKVREAQRKFVEEEVPTYLKELEQYEATILQPYEQQIAQAEQAQQGEDPQQAYRIARRYFANRINLKYAKGLVKEYLRELYQGRRDFLDQVQKIESKLGTGSKVYVDPIYNRVTGLKVPGSFGLGKTFFPSIEAYNQYIGEIPAQPTAKEIALGQSLYAGQSEVTDPFTAKFLSKLELSRIDGRTRADRALGSGTDLVSRPDYISADTLSRLQNPQTRKQVITQTLAATKRDFQNFLESFARGGFRLGFQLSKKGLQAAYLARQDPAFRKTYIDTLNKIGSPKDVRRFLVETGVTAATFGIATPARAVAVTALSSPATKLFNLLYGETYQPKTQVGGFGKGALAGYFVNVRYPLAGAALGRQFAVEALVEPRKTYEEVSETIKKRPGEALGFFIGGNLVKTGLDIGQQLNPLTRKPVSFIEPSIDPRIKPYTRPRVVALVKGEDGTILGKRGYLFAIDKNSGNYISIGGGREAGQSLTQALFAELKQETGLARSDILSKRLVDSFVTPRDTYYVYEITVRKAAEAKLRPGSDVESFKVFDPRTFTGYQGPSPAFPTGRPIFGLLGKRVRSEDAYLLSRIEGIKSIDKFLKQLSPNKKALLEYQAQQWFITRFGKQVASKITKRQIVQDYLLARLNLLPSQLYVKTKLGNLMLSPTSRYEIPRARQAEFAGAEEQLLTSGAPTGIPAENIGQYLTGKRQVRAGKTVRGEAAGLYLSPPRRPSGPGYAGLVYLGIGPEGAGLRFGISPKKRPTLYYLKEKISAELYRRGVEAEDASQLLYNARPGTIQPTPKALSGRELEVIATPNTILKKVGPPKYVRIGFRKVGVQQLKLVKVNQAVAERVKANLRYVRDPSVSSLSKKRAYEQLRRDTGIDYEKADPRRYVQINPTRLRQERERVRERPIEQYFYRTPERVREPRREIPRPRPERPPRPERREPIARINELLTGGYERPPREPPRIREPPRPPREPPRTPPPRLTPPIRTKPKPAKKKARYVERKRGRGYVRRPTQTQLLYNIRPRRRIPLSRLTGFEVAI